MGVIDQRFDADVRAGMLRDRDDCVGGGAIRHGTICVIGCPPRPEALFCALMKL